MVTNGLRRITQEEFDSALNNHFFYQKGDESKRMVFKDCDFSGIRIGENNLSGAIFDGSDFSSVLVYSNGAFGKRAFYYCTLDDVSFRDCNLSGIDFSGVHSMNRAILIGAKFQPKALGGFDNQIIATNEELQELLRKSEKVIEKQEEVIKEKDERLDQTSEKQSKDMLDIFSGLNRDFLKEEFVWLFVASFVSLFLIMFFSISIARFSMNLSWLVVVGVELVILLSLYTLSVLYSHDNPKIKEKINKDGSKLKRAWQFIKKGSSILWKGIVFLLISTLVVFVFSPKMQAILEDFKRIPFCHETQGAIQTFGSGETIKIGMNQQVTCIQKDEYIIVFSPLILLFISLLWFSVHQYGRAKKLRIEQQNKQAMIHFMQAIIASDGKVSKENQTFPQFSPFFANAIIHRPFSVDNYDPQLPIDDVKKIIETAKLL